jgi:hypothetical protein
MNAVAPCPMLPDGEFRTQMEGIWYDSRLVTLLRQKSRPSPYKDIGAVLHAQKALANVTRMRNSTNGGSALDVFFMACAFRASLCGMPLDDRLKRSRRKTFSSGLLHTSPVSL